MTATAIVRAACASATVGLLSAGAASTPSLPSPFGVLLVAGFGLGALALLARRGDPAADSG